MKPELKGFDSFPSETTSFTNGWFRMLIGPAGGDGEESFDVFVCTPEWSSSPSKREKAPRALVIDEMNVHKIEEILRARVDAVEGQSWGEIAAELSKFSYWEFDGYLKSE